MKKPEQQATEPLSPKPKKRTDEEPPKPREIGGPKRT